MSYTIRPIVPQQLSERERQVLVHFGHGLLVVEIARTMSLSVKTISTYLTRAQDKLRFNTRDELRTYAGSMKQPKGDDHGQGQEESREEEGEGGQVRPHSGESYPYR